MKHHSEVPLLPPRHEENYAHHHWVERMDYDGRACGLEVYQWQPQARKWCLPNQYARGGDSDTELLGYRHVAVCPTPPFPEEVRQVKPLRTWIADNVPPELREDFAVFRRLLAEHLDVGPR